MRRSVPFSTLLRGELRIFLRDRQAIVLLVLAPLLLYPVLFYAMGALQEASQSSGETREVTLAAPPELADWVREGDHLTLLPPGDESADAEVLLSPPDERRPPPRREEDDADSEEEDREARRARDLDEAFAVIVYRRDQRKSDLARDRADDVLRRWRTAEQEERWAAHGIQATPATLAEISWRDVSDPQARSGHALGRFLPLLFVFLAMSAGLYAALDVFAGEKERGTLETLLSTAAPRRSVLRAKFGVVLVTTGTMALLGLIGLGGSMATGLFTVPGSDEALSVPASTLVLAGLLMAPLVGVLSSVLAAAAAFVPDYRSGQALAFPLLLVLIAPAGLPLVPDMQLGVANALVPIGGVALAMRDALAGELQPALGLWAFVVSVGHAAAALWVAERFMGRETVLLGGGGRQARHARGRFGVEAVVLFLAAMVLFYFLGPLVGARDPVAGLVVGQGLLVAAAFVGVVALAQPLRSTLRLSPPAPLDLALGVVAGATAPGIAMTVNTLQRDILPVDLSTLEQFAAAFEVDLSLPAMVALFALTPAICEELLFRGAILGLLGKSLPRWGQVLLVGVLFGFIHASFFRVLPTGALGLVLTWAALRSGSLAIPVLMHFLNNALSVVGGEWGWIPDDGAVPLWQTVPAGLVCVAAVAAMGRGGSAQEPAR